ncbi:MAG: hypothetical protein KatS3mg035_1163 [Bacteroidia bacterium]|nr:MAG: hypothetical protein KatS3mg035_1163 [Bacteroidia bacterium]
MAGLLKILDIHKIKTDDYDIFIETGLFDGNNISTMFKNGCFKNLECAYSVELNKDYVDKAYANFPFLLNSNVKLLHGDSGFVLEDILSKNQDKKILLWLDAHYSSGNTAKSDTFGECPIIAEINSIKHLKNKPTIIIDDLGCFMQNTPFYYNGWPKIDQVIEIAKNILILKFF